MGNERNPGFKVITVREEVKRNYDNLVAHVGCNCVNCAPRIHEEALFHIKSAPLQQQRFLTEEILIADIVTMHSSKRRQTILHSIEEAKNKPKKLSLWQ